jgi:hypothetical protein
MKNYWMMLLMFGAVGCASSPLEREGDNQEWVRDGSAGEADGATGGAKGDADAPKPSDTGEDCKPQLLEAEKYLALAVESGDGKAIAEAKEKYAIAEKQCHSTAIDPCKEPSDDGPKPGDNGSDKGSKAGDKPGDDGDKPSDDHAGKPGEPGNGKGEDVRKNPCKAPDKGDGSKAPDGTPDKDPEPPVK